MNIYSLASSIPEPAVNRRQLDGPVVADLAEATTPAIAQSDARWAAAVLAGGAKDAAELRAWLRTVGLLPAAPYWMGAAS